MMKDQMVVGMYRIHMDMAVAVDVADVAAAAAAAVAAVVVEGDRS